MEKRISTDENEPFKCNNCGERISLDDDSCPKCETQIPMDQKFEMSKSENGGREEELSKRYDEKSFASVAVHIKEEHKEQARENLKTWFG